MQSSGLFRKVG